MTDTAVLKREQHAVLQRPRVTYSRAARLLFAGMDMLYGKKTTLPKMRLLEILARIPYQAWETRHYHLLSHAYDNDATVGRANDIIGWSRHAQDNEFWHLRVIEKRMKKCGIVESWFRRRIMARCACFSYRLTSALLARFGLEKAFRLNGDFEDHAEHVYMQFVEDHPELDNEPVKDPVVDAVGGPYAHWGDVFRRIALDERDHRNQSFRRCGLTDHIVPNVE